MAQITGTFDAPQTAWIDTQRRTKTREQFVQDATLRGYTPPPETWGKHLGLCGDLKDAAFAASIGCGWFRSSPEYGWGVTADAVKQQTATLHGLGMKHLVVVQDAGHNYDDVLADATYRTGFLAWVRSLASACDGIELLNEPNLGPTRKIFWTGIYDKTWTQQARLMFDMARAIKTANPTCLVITGGFSPYGNDDGGTYNLWPHFAIQDLLKQIDVLAKQNNLSGVAATIDGVGQHLYETKYDPRSGPDPAHQGWWAVKRNRDLWFGCKDSTGRALPAYPGIAQYGIPIWNTEFGQKRADFASDAIAAQHMSNYFGEYTSQRAAGIKFGAHFVIHKTAFDGDWRLDAATQAVVKQQSAVNW